MSLRNIVDATAPGTKIDVKIVREGMEKTITIILGEYKENKGTKKTEEYANVLVCLALVKTPLKPHPPSQSQCLKAAIRNECNCKNECT